MAWRRKYPRKARFSTTCHVCGDRIAEGDEIAYKPGMAADHWSCYMKGRDEPHDPGASGDRRYAASFYSGSSSRQFSDRAKSDWQAIARAKERQNSRLNRRTESDVSS